MGAVWTTGEAHDEAGVTSPPRDDELVATRTCDGDAATLVAVTPAAVALPTEESDEERHWITRPTPAVTPLSDEDEPKRLSGPSEDDAPPAGAARLDPWGLVGPPGGVGGALLPCCERCVPKGSSIDRGACSEDRDDDDASTAFSASNTS